MNWEAFSILEISRQINSDSDSQSLDNWATIYSRIWQNIHGKTSQDWDYRTCAPACVSPTGQVLAGSFPASFLIPMPSHHCAHPSASRVMHFDCPGHKGSREDDNVGHTWSLSCGQAPGWVLSLIADPYFGHTSSSLYSIYRWGTQTSVCSRTPAR